MSDFFLIFRKRGERIGIKQVVCLVTYKIFNFIRNVIDRVWNLVGETPLFSVDIQSSL